jgi:hypothetical protein
LETRELPFVGHIESFLGSFLGLTITSTPQGCFVYWKDFEPSKLLDYESRLMAFTQELPFQEGRPLSPIAEGESSTELLEYSLRANHSADRQVCMASLHNVEEDERGTQYNNDQLEDIPADEPIANAPQDEDEKHRQIRRAKNAKIAPANQGISTTLLQQSRIASTIRRLVPLQK